MNDSDDDLENFGLGDEPKKITFADRPGATVFLQLSEGMHAGQYDAVDNLLQHIVPSRFSPTALCAFLSATKHAEHRLPSRALLVTGCRSALRLHRTEEQVADLLRGID